MKRFFILTTLVLLGLIGRGQVNSDTLKLIGKYEGVICFKNECLTQKLQIKSDHKYKVRRSSNAGNRGKSTEYGTWLLEKDILILKPDVTSKNTKAITYKYKIINSDMWYFSEETLNPLEIAMKRK